jgi:formylglycine-generating enzyme required for sulfatase activity
MNQGGFRMKKRISSSLIPLFVFIICYILQAATAETSSLVKMITIIPDGGTASFLMGSTGEELKSQPHMDHKDYYTDDEQPAHKVTLNHSYAMSKFEITNNQFCEVMNWAISRNYAKLSDGDLFGGNGKKYLGITHLLKNKYLGVQHGIVIQKKSLTPAPRIQ